MVTNLTIALAISLTGQVETKQTKLCNLKCTGHTKDVVIDNSLDITQNFKYIDGLESGYILLCEPRENRDCRTHPFAGCVVRYR